MNTTQTATTASPADPNVLLAQLAAHRQARRAAADAAEQCACAIVRGILPAARELEWEADSEYDDEGGFVTSVFGATLKLDGRDDIEVPADGDNDDLHGDDIYEFEEAHPEMDQDTARTAFYAQLLQIAPEHVDPLFEAVQHLVWLDASANHYDLAA